MKLPSKLSERKSVRMKSETVEFLESQGPTSTVINTIIEKSIKNWQEFEKLPD